MILKILMSHDNEYFFKFQVQGSLMTRKKLISITLLITTFEFLL